MSTEERSESLASQAAAWVPPWERRSAPDPAYAAAAPPVDLTDDDPAPDDDDLADDDAAAGDAGEEAVPAELPPIPGEATGPVTVDAPQELPGEEELLPTDVGLPPELPVPDALEAAEAADDGMDAGSPVDAPAPDDDGPRQEPREPAGSTAPPRDRGIVDAAAPAVAARVRTPGKAQETQDLPPIDDAELRAALEAILLVVDEPVGELQLAQIVEQPAERVATMLEDISGAYTSAGHGFDLRRAAGGWRLYTRPEYAPYVERFVLDGQSVRLTQAALETLAVIAYKQPVTRSRISVIRGVNCDGVMRTLVTRGLVEECGIESETGAFLYRTTTLFLEKLGLDSVDQLPPLAPFLPDDVEEVLDAQR